MTSPPLTEKWVPLWPTHSQYQLGDEMACVEITTNVICPATSAAAANPIVTAPALTFDGATPAIIEFFAPYSTVGATTWGIALYDGATQLGTMVNKQSTSVYELPVYGKVRITPTSGVHTYSIRGFCGAGAFTVFAGTGAAGQLAPAFMRVSRVNAVPPTVLPGPITPVTYGITLPAAPADGQEAILVDSLTAPTYAWRLLYVASITDAYKWVYIGGYHLGSAVETQETTVSTSYADLATVGPQFTLPRAGIYLLDYGAYVGNDTASREQFVSPKLGAAATSDNEAAMGWVTSGIGGSWASRKMTVSGLAAAALIKLQYKTSGNTGGFRKRYLYVTPVRVA